MLGAHKVLCRAGVELAALRRQHSNNDVCSIRTTRAAYHNDVCNISWQDAHVHALACAGLPGHAPSRDILVARARMH